MSGTRVPSAPGPQYDTKWMYWFWDWIKANRAGNLVAGGVLTGDVLSTFGTLTSTTALSTTGVAAGTYGAATVLAQFAVDAKGRLGSAANAGTLSTFAVLTALVLSGDVLGTSTTGTITNALSTTGITAGVYGGPGTFAQLTVDAKGRATAGSRFDLGAVSPILNTGGTLSHATSGVLAGTYGNATAVGQFAVNNFGLVSSAGNVGISISATGITAGSNASVTAPIIFSTGDGTASVLKAFAIGHDTSGVTAGTYGGTAGLGRFNIDSRGHVAGAFNVTQLGSAPILITVPGTGTVAWGHDTSGVAAGTYGTGRALAQVVVDAKGHVTGAGAAGTLGTMGYLDSYVMAGDVLGTSTTGTFTAALSTTGVAAGTYGGIVGDARYVVDAKGRLSASTYSDRLASSPILLATNTGLTGIGTLVWSHATSGVAAGTYGGIGGIPRFDISSLGLVVGATSADLSVAAPITLSTLTGTVGVGTLQWGHNTSGVAAGTYGTGGTMVSQVTVDAKGHVTVMSNVGISFPAMVGTMAFSGDALGTGTLGGTTALALSTTGVNAATYGGTAGLARFDIDAKGRMTGAFNVALVGSNLTITVPGTGTVVWNLATSGVAAGTYSQVVVDAFGRVTIGGTSTSGGGGSTWQQNRFTLNSGETLAITSNNEVVFGPTFIHTSGGTLSVAAGGRMVII